MEIGEEIESKDHGAIGGVFEGHNTVQCGACLNGGKDVFDGGVRHSFAVHFLESLYSCLDVV